MDAKRKFEKKCGSGKGGRGYSGGKGKNKDKNNTKTKKKCYTIGTIKVPIPSSEFKKTVNYNMMQ